MGEARGGGPCHTPRLAGVITVEAVSATAGGEFTRDRNQPPGPCIFQNGAARKGHSPCWHDRLRGDLSRTLAARLRRAAAARRRSRRGRRPHARDILAPVRPPPPG